MFRAGFIFGGAALLRQLDWVVYPLGILLLATAWRVARHGDKEIDPEHNPILRWVRGAVPQTEEYREHHFVVREGGRLLVTPLFVVVVTVEMTDILFAVDSIPAILAITRNEFLVFSSNAFAILGLRALYFLLDGLEDRFAYLNKGLGIILALVGVKFILGDVVHVPVWVSLAFIAVVITAAILLSLWAEPQRQGEQQAAGGGRSHDRRSGDE